MNRELSMILSLKRVLTEVATGRGIANAVVSVSSADQKALRDVARRILLGSPPEKSMKSLARGQSQEVGLLAELIADASKGDVVLASKKGEGLSGRVEEWVKGKEIVRAERRILALRGAMVSGVLGAVLAMLSSVAPLFNAAGLAQPGQISDPTPMKVTAAAMTLVSSGVLGLFISGREFLFYSAISLAVFGVVTLSFAPLSNSVFQLGWPIK